MVSLKCHGCSLVTERLAGKIPTRESWYTEEQAERDLDQALGAPALRSPAFPDRSALAAPEWATAEFPSTESCAGPEFASEPSAFLVRRKVA